MVRELMASLFWLFVIVLLPVLGWAVLESDIESTRRQVDCTRYDPVESVVEETTTGRSWLIVPTAEAWVNPRRWSRLKYLQRVELARRQMVCTRGTFLRARIRDSYTGVDLAYYGLILGYRHASKAQ